MIGEISGYLGSGKTLLLTYLALTVPKKTPIYANYHIELPNVKFIDINDLEQIKKGLLLLDEAYLWLDSRCSGKEINRYLSYLLFQSRKREFDVFATAPINTSLDLRYRFVTDLNIIALGNENNCFQYFFNGWGNTKTVFLPSEDVFKVFKIYDTLEYPDLEPTIYEPIKLNKIVDKTVKKIQDEYGERPKITKGIIGDIMLENGNYNERIIEMVFNRFKRIGMENKDE